MFGESGGYDLKYRSTIDVSELRKWWDRSPPARGRIELSGSIAGLLTDPRLAFDLRAREFAVGALSDGSLDATGHASIDSIVIETCALRSVEGVFNGRGRVALRDDDGRSLLAGEWSLPRLRALKELGYYSGALNGSLGPATRAAISAFQEDNDLEITGVVDEVTVEALGLY